MRSEVKGVWFVSARAWLEERGVLATAAKSLPPSMRSVLLEPIPTAWYPEATLQQALSSVRATIAPDADQFRDAMDGCTVIGTSRFFRALLRLASPDFVLRQVPTMWRHIRRGDAKVETSSAQADHARVAYSGFPFFGDENYRLLTQASLRAVVRTCTGRNPEVTIDAWTADSLTVDVRWSARATSIRSREAPASKRSHGLAD